MDFGPFGDWFASTFAWFPTFATSPGFGGACAVIAAAIAYSAAVKNGRRDQRFRMVESAVGMMRSGVKREMNVGQLVAENLAPRMRGDQAVYVKAITNLALDPEADGDEEDDYPYDDYDPFVDDLRESDE